MKKKLQFVVLLCVLVSSIVFGAIPASERAALIALYNSTNGDGWSNNSGWKTAPLDSDGFAMPGTEGTWYGIAVVNTLGIDRVTYISLSSNKLSGNIPLELGNLTNLILLVLRENQLTGNIPSQLGNLSNLGLLVLYSNQLTGIIPVELSNLTNLTTLSLHSNQLSGSIPPELSNLTNITELSLYSNQLTGSIPIELGNLTSLQNLSLASNQLTGIIPHELSNLTNLTKLSLYSNQLSGSIPSEFSNLTNLIELSLSSNQLSGNIPDELGNITTLKNLSLGYNQLSGSIPVELGNLTTLNNLSLGSNQLTGIIPIELNNLTNLNNLILSSNQLTGSIPPELDTLSVLRYLSLSENQLTGNIPPELGNIATLNYLYLNTNQLTGNIPPELGNLTNLQYLVIHYNKLIEDVPSSLINLISMNYLNIGYNCLTATDPDVINWLNSEDPDWNDNQNQCNTEPTIILTSPNGGENVEVGTMYSITWTNTDTINNVKIEYSENNGSSWIEIESSTANTGTYNWTVPNTPSSNTLVKISDTVSSASDSSNAVFTISTPNQLPIAEANGPYSVFTGDNVNFSSTGSNDLDGTIVSYLWNFGDGTTSSLANPTHLYAAAGNYTSTLTVIDNAGATGSDTASVTITNLPLPVADFTASSVTINEGENVTFTDTSSNNPVSWSWTFTGGSPGSSTTRNPSVTYNTAGTYAVSLTVVNAGGSDSITKNAYITVEAIGIAFEKGSLSNVSSNWQTVNLNNTYISPVVICSNDMGSNKLPAVTRIRNASGNSFEVRVQNPSGSALTGYKVYYTVVEEGVYTIAQHGVKMEAVRASSTKTAEDKSWGTEARIFQNSYSNPVVLGQVMTHNDPDWSVFWANGKRRADSPTSSNFNAGKEVGEDPDNTRSDETIGYIVIEAGSGTINNINYIAGVTSDSIKGTDNNNNGYSYTYGSISNASSVLVSAGAGMDGGNGGWPVLFGASQLSDTAINLYFDEDQLKDSERKHTPERVTFIVYGQ